MARSDLRAKLVGYKENHRKVFIQIDGLPYDMLKRAIGEGYAPALKKMIKKKQMFLKPYFSELPSNTPAAQMKIMYGLRNRIKAFRWYDKGKNIHHTFKLPATAEYFEQIGESESQKPILKDGASYINLYSGGAKRAVLTLSRARSTELKKSIGKKELWKNIFINIDFIFSVMFKLVKEFFIELSEYASYKIRKIPQRDETFFPYVRMLNSVFFREIATAGAIVEMNEMTPAVYVTYNGYDEVGHQRGPESREALKTLKDIDRNIKMLNKYAKKKGYSLYIFSDHGQTTTIPFESRYGISLKELINEILENDEAVELFGMGNETKQFLYFYFIKKSLKGLALFGGSIFKVLTWALKRLFIMGEKSGDNTDETDAGAITAACSGPIAHIYFNGYKARYKYVELEKEYNSIFSNIIKHDGIEFGAVQTENGYLIKGKNGEIELNKNFEIIKKENSPFINIFTMEMCGGEINTISTDEEAAMWLRDVVEGDDVGDMVLFGGVIDTKTMVNFEGQYGGHGGLGGRQNYPFLMSKIQIDGDISIIDLYDIFS